MFQRCISPINNLRLAHFRVNKSYRRREHGVVNWWYTTLKHGLIPKRYIDRLTYQLQLDHKLCISYHRHESHQLNQHQDDVDNKSSNLCHERTQGWPWVSNCDIITGLYYKQGKSWTHFLSFKLCGYNTPEGVLAYISYTGMCRPNGLPFHQKSLDMGPILVKKSLEEGQQ